MPAKPKNCGTCKWSRWTLTPGGRIPKNGYGECFVKITMPELPACCEILGPLAIHRGRIYQEFGTDCPLYELNEGKPVAR